MFCLRPGHSVIAVVIEIEIQELFHLRTFALKFDLDMNSFETLTSFPTAIEMKIHCQHKSLRSISCSSNTRQGNTIGCLIISFYCMFQFSPALFLLYLFL